MSSISTSRMLFRPLLVAGMIITGFGITCIWIGSSLELQEEGAGFTIIGWRFLVSGLVCFIFAYVAKYSDFITSYTRFMLKQIRYRRNPEENRFSGWYKP